MYFFLGVGGMNRARGNFNRAQRQLEGDREKR